MTREEKLRLLATTHKHACSDNQCVFALTSRGVGTNGGCRCLGSICRDPQTEYRDLRRKVHEFLADLRGALR